MLVSYFHVCKLWVLPRRHWWNVKTLQLIIVLSEPQNMLICHTIFHCELFSRYILFAECENLNFVDAGRRMHTASPHGLPLARHQSNGLILLVMSFFLFFKHFIPSIFNCLCIVWKHLQSLLLCNFCWLASTLETWKYDVTSSKEYPFFYRRNTFFLLNIPWKFCENLNIFHKDIKKRECVFFLNTVYMLHVFLTYTMLLVLYSNWTTNKVLFFLNLN